MYTYFFNNNNYIFIFWLQEYYNQLVSDGKFEPNGSNDVLTMALGTPESRGRVRGIGLGVRPTQFWKTPLPSKNKGKEIGISSADARITMMEEKYRQQEDHMKRQEEMIRQLMEQMKGQYSGVGGSSHASAHESPINESTPSHQVSPQYKPPSPPPPKPDDRQVFIPTPNLNQV